MQLYFLIVLQVLGILNTLLFSWLSIGKKAIPVLREFLVQYDSAKVTINSDQEQIAQLMEPLGLHHKRAQILMQFSSKLYIMVFFNSYTLTIFTIIVHVHNYVYIVSGQLFTY